MSEKDPDKNKVNEPSAEYQKQEIRFFNSFEEMNESQYAHWRSLTPEQRLNDLEQMRKTFLSKYLLPNGEWPLDKILKIKEPFA